MTAILGPSGRGKTTLLSLLGGLDLDYEGTIAYEGEPLPRSEGPKLRRYRSETVALVLQERNLVSHLTSAENAALPLLLRSARRADALARAEVHLRQLGLGDVLERRAHELSGGQRQRVALARAFTADAPVILADEPTASLDRQSAQTVLRGLRRLVDEEGRSVVLVTHDEGLARRWCDGRVRFRPRRAPHRKERAPCAQAK
jgi:putative ABC transport system ATP-binding protein